ncbi:PadR family transcriptional regulator [Raineyella fluvialis]|uniref:PadR family transcriptional regulator n=1 Tax=Raineyella fluvialis TaxID=2662261 RepID=A0A5Q2FAS2_9ACTN|nr:PadR family transcriptional regulator [Raineyella fluvialis]QGF22817.1 PadR family transcriptional regulator [Raineyella fluvialis]
MISDRWPAEWLRGVLSVTVLAVIAEGETYGYLIGQRLDDAGLGRIKGGTLYPLLSRQEASGLVSSTWREGDGGPGRKFYRITAEGTRELERLRSEWAAFTTITATLIGSRAEEGDLRG